MITEAIVVHGGGNLFIKDHIHEFSKQIVQF